MSEYEDQEQPLPDVDHEEPSVVPAVEPDTAEPPEPPEPPELAEPGIYMCEEPDPGIHPVLGRLQEGENDFSTETDPQKLEALAAAVAGGLLKKA